GGGEHDGEELAAMLAHLDPEDFRDQDRWFTLMQASHHATAGDGRQEFVDWSTGDPLYADDAGLIGRRWDSLHSDNAGARVTYRTLHKFMTDAGAGDAVPRGAAADDFDAVSADDVPADLTERVKRGVRSLPAIHEGGLQVHPKTSVAPDNFANALKAVSKSGLQPRFDELKQRVVLTGELPWGEEYGRVLDDKVLMLARTWLMQRLQGNDYQPSKENVLEALTTVAFYYKFNPIIDYLDGLTWDGTPRVGSLFDRGFQCGQDDYTEAVSRCFMVGAVARQRDPGCKFDTMPVVNGPQGAQKSSGFRDLFSREWFSDAEMGDLRSKDAPMNLEGVWLHEFAELAGLRTSDMNVLKAFMSRAVDRYRSPYGRTTADHPRRAVFSGTLNAGGYLGDPTGARRFWPLTMRPGTRVDLDWIGANRDQLWAEADALYRAGASAVLPERLWATAAERQAEETVEDPWGDQVDEMLRRRTELRAAFEAGTGDFAPETVGGREVASPLDEPPRPDRVHTHELLSHLGLGGDRQSHAHAQRLRRVMEAKGWRYRRGVRVGERVAAGYVQGEG
ncbi:MAG: PriCT-2 domain-containing protein, partial [Phenylobacterium sp.]|nr:PriCT-2 domain-containing protein [Phenylobacterium sp.]